MYAHYYATKKTKILLITPDEKASLILKKFEVKGKVAARKKAKELNATPWNF
jgi:hypothetical protein